MSELKLKWEDVESSNVRSVAFIEEKNALCVQFHNGGIYSYNDVDMEVYTDLMHAESIGKFLNAQIKPYYRYHKYEDMQDLQRTFAVG